MAKDRKLYLNERTTIRDVAQEAGVSLTTVSHALNGYKDVSEKTRQKVMEVARRLDYIPDEAAYRRRQLHCCLPGNCRKKIRAVLCLDLRVEFIRLPRKWSMNLRFLQCRQTSR